MSIICTVQCVVRAATRQQNDFDFHLGSHWLCLYLNEEINFYKFHLQLQLLPWHSKSFPIPQWTRSTFHSSIRLIAEVFNYRGIFPRNAKQFKHFHFILIDFFSTDLNGINDCNEITTFRCLRSPHSIRFGSNSMKFNEIWHI